MTEQNKDGTKSGCTVLEGRSTCLSFFLFLYHAYPIILMLQTESNVFIFLCCTFHCVNSNMFNEFSILTRLIK